MVSLTAVFDFIDRRIDKMEREAAGPCADAILELVGRDEYRDAVRKASAMRAVKRLRKELADWGESSEALAERDLLASAQPIPPAALPAPRRRKA